MISLIETGVLIILKIAGKSDNSPVTLNQLAGQSKSNELLIVRNDKLMKFDEQQVHYLLHKDGCIFLVDENGQRYTTQFNALTEVEEKLSKNFFRANRQIIVSREAICRLQKVSNHKLRISVEHLPEEVTISRYKNHAFKKWLYV